MPELPEVETIRLFLDKQIIKKTISDLDILSKKSFVGDPSKIINQKIKKISRLGKQLSIFLDNDLILHIHLKMTGQLLFQSHSLTILGHPTPSLYQNPLPWKSTRVIFTFLDSSKLYFNDQRKFGWIKLLDQKSLDLEHSHLGPDILSPDFSQKYFSFVLNSSNRLIKTLLHDQSKFAGIGNIYANDALYLSKIHPKIKANQLTSFQAKTLHKNIIKVIKEGIDNGGSTAKDNGYLCPDGSKGSQQYNFKVYQKAGEICSICSSKIIRLKLQGRSAFFCPNCQKEK